MTEDVPGYRVLEQVGEGGFSVVYRAHQERLDRMVALKVLSISAVDDAAMRRFQRECKITGRLSGHPNVVTVLDTGTTRAGRPYIAMEYFEHGALTDRLDREGPLPVAEVLRIGVKMAGALAATHDTDVLHRDIKPQNILVSRYGEPALADFGIARLVDSFDHSHTQAFTPHHAAPEVLEGRTPGVGSDIYSLGSTLYQLLAGHPAFKGPAGEGIAQLMLRILNEPPPPFKRSDVPRPVHAAITRAMAKLPEQRFSGAVELARHFQQLQHDLGLPITDLAHTGGSADFLQPGAAESSPWTQPGGESSSGFRPPPPSDRAPTSPGQTAPAAAPPVLDAPAEKLSPWHPAAAQQPAAPVARQAVAPQPVAPPPVAPQPVAPQPMAPQPVAPQPVAPGPAVQSSPPPSPLAAQGTLSAPGGGLTWPPAAEPERTGTDGPRRGLIVAAAVALVGGAVVGVTALALSDGDDPKPPKNGTPVPPTTAVGGDTGGAISPETRAAARPLNVAVRRAGGAAIVTWKLSPGGRDLPMIVQRAPWWSTPVVNAGTGATSARVGRLAPQQRHCFRVGAILRIPANGKQPEMAWSETRCVGRTRPGG